MSLPYSANLNIIKNSQDEATWDWQFLRQDSIITRKEMICNL